MADISNEVNKLYGILCAILGENDLSYSNISGVIVKLMQSVEQFQNTDGQTKKKMIITVINQYLNNKSSDKSQCDVLTNLILPELIDLIISLDKNQIKIHINKCMKIFGCLKSE